MSSADKRADDRYEALVRRIHEAFPSLQWSNHRFIGEGWDHEVIVLDEKLIFRFPTEENYRALLASEVEVLRRLQPLVDVPIPNYTYIAADGSFAGYPMIPGKPLHKAYFDSLDPESRDTIARQIAGFLTTLHTVSGFEHDLPHAYMADDQVEVRQLVKQHLSTVLNSEDLVSVENMLAEVDVVIAQEHPLVFIHGDLYHSHLLWDEAVQQLGIIDFGDRNLGDPAIDFAELHEYGEDFVNQVYGYYAGSKDNAFIDRSWIYQCWTGVYMLTDYFVNHKISLEESRELFDWTKKGKRP